MCAEINVNNMWKNAISRRNGYFCIKSGSDSLIMTTSCMPESCW